MSDLSFTEPMTVEKLKALNFDKLSKQEKLNVKLRGRPTPIIQLYHLTNLFLKKKSVILFYSIYLTN